MTTYRAAYWISDDEQAEEVLTSEAQAGLDDDALRAAAEAQAARVGLDLSTGEIRIGQWTDPDGAAVETRRETMASTTETLWEQATEGLTVAREHGIVSVYDGQDQWLCREYAWDDASVELGRMPALDSGEDSDEAEAYDRLCRTVAGPICSTIGTDRGDVDALADLARRAIGAGLIDEDSPIAERYAEES
jgi:hypothetical protein